MRYIISLLLLIFPILVQAKILFVSNQQEFDNLATIVKVQFDNGEKNVIVNILPGHYLFSENHFNTSGWNYPDANLTILGIGATLTGKGNRYDSSNNIYLGADPISSCWLDGNFQEINAWSDIYQSPNPVEILDRTTGKCRIACSDHLPDYQFEKSTPKTLRLTQWYLAEDYRIDEIRDNYLYFTAPNIKTSNYGDNVNWDVGFGKTNPRFLIFNEDMLVNGHVQVNSNSIFESVTSCCFNITSASLNKLRIYGIRFIGNAHNSPLISIRNFHGKQIVINHCHFQYLHSKCIGIVASEHVTITNSTFLDCQRYGITTDNNCSDIRVTSNQFFRVGKGIGNSHVVTMAGKDFLISRNYVEDFCYAAFGIGVWYGNKKDNPCTGIIERNEICYSTEFFDNSWKHTLMDGGAIYTFTKMDNVVIRYNYIHDYTGVKAYRGIFCDDGALNVSIYGNLLRNIKGSYDIDLRYVSSNSVAQNVPEFNMHNQLFENFMDGYYRFEGRPDVDDDCILKTNYLLGNGELRAKNSTKYIQSSSEDIHLDSLTTTKVENTYKKYIKKNSLLNNINKCINNN